MSPLEDHSFRLSHRYHQDQVQRFHEAHFKNMVNGLLENHGSLGQRVSLLNRSKAKAHTLSFLWEGDWGDLETQGVLRFEDIEYEQEDFQMGIEESSRDQIFAPGFGLFYHLTPHWGLLAGVNKGVTPVGPGQGESVKQEEAMNYEFGFRRSGDLSFEWIGFYSDCLLYTSPSPRDTA